MRRRLIATGAAVALVVLVAAPLSGVASAQTPCPAGPGGYPPGATSLSVTPTVVAEGGTVDASGCTTPNGPVGFVLTSHPQNLGSARANAAGFFSARLTIPCGTEQGRHTLTASGAGSAALTVRGVTGSCVGAPGAGGAGGVRGALARTGSASLLPLAAAGIGLLLIGAFTVAAARRRRTVQAVRS